MAGRAKSKKPSRKSGGTKTARRFRPLRWLTRAVAVLVVVFLAVLLLYSRVNPPVTITMIDAWRTHGALERDWLPIAEMAPVLPRSVVAAEDANFCRHWGFDLDAIQAAIDDGARRGASTISQQTAKNVFFWQGRSWFRKALAGPISITFRSRRFAARCG
jgi:monofunctional biosynthetic peptidoglycan transglycosylase